jgi:hypothetical protein
MTLFQSIIAALSAPGPMVYIAAVAVVLGMLGLFIALSALVLGKEIRWSQHGYWKRKDAKAKPANQNLPPRAPNP